MRGPEDLNPDDRDLRLNLRDMFIERRVDLGLTQTELGQRCGLTKNTVGALERTESWRLINMQRLAHGLGWHLVLEPDGLPVDPAAIAGFRPADPERAHRWDQQTLAASLLYARTALGLTQTVLGERLGIGMRAVSMVETARGGLMFVTPQR